MSTLLLSDLHLPAHASPLRERFLDFLRGPARQAQRVFILGDLFEVWMGDDLGQRDYAAEISALRELSEHGVELGLMHGNRDFLVGSAFASASGVQLLSDPMVITLGGIPTLLSHGDAWCLDDVGYQRWRRVGRKAWVQALFLALPAQLRQGITQKLRERSSRAQQHKNMEIMDVQPAAVSEAFRQHGVNRIIHGHTHRPATHAHAQGERIVLADWRTEHCEYLHLDEQGRCTRRTV